MPSNYATAFAFIALSSLATAAPTQDAEAQTPIMRLKCGVNRVFNQGLNFHLEPETAGQTIDVSTTEVTRLELKVPHGKFLIAVAPMYGATETAPAIFDSERTYISDSGDQLARTSGLISTNWSTGSGFPNPTFLVVKPDYPEFRVRQPEGDKLPLKEIQLACSFVEK
jgi:hypothetical protein